MTYSVHDDVGVICMQESSICYSSPAPRLGEWRFSTNDLAIVGEFTTEDGPFWFDWYVAFVRSDAEWVICPANARGMKEVLDALQERLCCPLHTAMYASARYASRIMFPARSAEKPLLAFKTLPWSIWSFWKFWRSYQVALELSDDARALLSSDSGANPDG